MGIVLYWITEGRNLPTSDTDRKPSTRGFNLDLVHFLGQIILCILKNNIHENDDIKMHKFPIDAPYQERGDLGSIVALLAA